MHLSSAHITAAMASSREIIVEAPVDGREEADRVIDAPRRRLQRQQVVAADHAQQQAVLICARAPQPSAAGVRGQGSHGSLAFRAKAEVAASAVDIIACPLATCAFAALNRVKVPTDCAGLQGLRGKHVRATTQCRAGQ